MKRRWQPLFKRQQIQYVPKLLDSMPSKLVADIYAEFNPPTPFFIRPFPNGPLNSRNPIKER